ncbi:TetR/AcrR family transcriptional regulator [Clostridium sp.]|jgi:AcrR family transcriptional regulator|uniref:TetR/AcrR family transcriptional regulator n=1 Tax=Clostridium sp. TaxID=1506 RepID=UPI00284E6598|nr:TetR/AcrR family transcriptional regulator [Clostridium sp.]MDR3595435.1 TetR/AcrR family transcriptional regulator [Clostridium sp.]
MNTRDKIIYESLNLFSKRGFDAISVRDIAKAVGIKASSLYNHFKNKQDILDTIINQYSNYITKFFDHIITNYDINEIIVNKLKWFSNEYFFKKSIYIFKFYLEDEYVIKFRKLLTIEQFTNSKIAALYNKIFVDDILEFHSKIFELLMNADIFVKKDPYILALQFYSPAFLLFYKDDNLTNKELTSLENHINEFKHAYTLKG